MAKYVHEKSEAKIILRSTKTLVIDHDKVTVSPLILEFHNHHANTKGMNEEEEVIRLMDAWLDKNPRQRWVSKMPSDDELKKITSVAKKIEKAKEKAVAVAMEKIEGAEEMLKEKQSFDAFVAKTKANQPIQGMRDVGR